MNRVMTRRIDGVAWDFIYQALVLGLGVAATAAVYLEITSF